MYLIINENNKIIGCCSKDVSNTNIEVSMDFDWQENDETALFFENGEFVRKNIFDLNKYKSKIKNKIYLDCKNEMESGNKGLESQYISAKVDCREIDILRLDQFIALLEAEGKTEDDLVDYICYDNSFKKVKLSDVKKAKIELINAITQMMYKKHQLYSQIAEAETKEELDAIVWDF